ncbi:hypothetical protein [Streptomyces sp. NPDC001155]
MAHDEEQVADQAEHAGDLAEADSSYDDFLVEAKKRASSPNPLEIPISDLLAFWNAKRRRHRIVARIVADLAAEGLQTTPDLDAQNSWESVQITRLPQADAPPGEPVGIKIGSLEAAKIWAAGADPDNTSGTPKIPSLSRDESLATAGSMMLASNLDQLPVTAGRALEGAVSWQSIARAQFVNPHATLRDAIVPAKEVQAEDDLLSVIPQIVESGFVFVRDRRNVLTGVVTTADLSRTFDTLTRPFLLIAEIERRLRKIIDRKIADGSFTQEELRAAVQGEGRDPAVSAADLTISEYQSLLGSREMWERLGWQADRKIFVKALDEVRQIRNDIMHFDPDPLDTSPLVGFLDWLRLQHPKD